MSWKMVGCGILPALGAILILIIGALMKGQSSWIKKFATAWLVLDFVASLWLFGYDRSIGGMQFLEDHQWIPAIGARSVMRLFGTSSGSAFPSARPQITSWSSGMASSRRTTCW